VASLEGNKTKIPHCQNSSIIQSKNRRNRGKINTPNTYTWPLCFLAWYRHFSKK